MFCVEEIFFHNFEYNQINIFKQLSFLQLWIDLYMQMKLFTNIFKV
jgi:hypothetical protein